MTELLLSIGHHVSVFSYMTAAEWYIGILLPFVAAFVTTAWMHPLIVRMAKRRNMTDEPEQRKLQSEPVPVMGGMAVFFGIVIGSGAVSMFFDTQRLFIFIIALTVMMYCGMLDDMIDLSPWTRIVLELMVVAFVVRMDGMAIDSLQGVFGIGALPVWLWVPLTAVACVGIINAINLIDGVNGLSSGYCFLACICFGFVFVASKDTAMAIMAFLAAGALLPFWFHNVFGRKSKMFIGDSGTMMMGLLMSIFCLHAIGTGSLVVKYHPHIGVVAFCLSILSVPVFDCLRVMTGRIIKGVSPFLADKSHLHHLFIEMGASHLGAATGVILLNVSNTLCWFLSYILGGGPTVQFLVVAVVGFTNTFAFYYIVKHLSHDRLAYRLLRRACLNTTLWQRGGVSRALSRFVDRF